MEVVSEIENRVLELTNCIEEDLVVLYLLDSPSPSFRSYSRRGKKLDDPSYIPVSIDEKLGILDRDNLDKFYKIIRERTIGNFSAIVNLLEVRKVIIGKREKLDDAFEYLYVDSKKRLAELIYRKKEKGNDENYGIFYNGRNSNDIITTYLGEKFEYNAI